MSWTSITCYLNIHNMFCFHFQITTRNYPTGNVDFHNFRLPVTTVTLYIDPSIHPRRTSDPFRTARPILSFLFPSLSSFFLPLPYLPVLLFVLSRSVPGPDRSGTRRIFNKKGWRMKKGESQVKKFHTRNYDAQKTSKTFTEVLSVFGVTERTVCSRMHRPFTYTMWYG